MTNFTCSTCGKPATSLISLPKVEGQPIKRIYGCDEHPIKESITKEELDKLLSIKQEEVK